MIPYKQLYEHDPDNGIWGDCGRTAIACLLERHPETVPHFWYEDDPLGLSHCRRWLNKRGYDYTVFPLQTVDLSIIFDIMESQNKDQYYILLGTSSNNINHVVICKGNKIVHDPSPTNSGIIGPADDGYFWIELLTKQL